MDARYHDAIVAAQYDALTTRVDRDALPVTVDREGTVVFVAMAGRAPDERYRVRIDLSRFPIEPYWVGFIDPDLPREEWLRVSDTDPRYWPWSPMPALHGHFNIHFQGAFRTFWCVACTVPFFWYHGHDHTWEPAKWPLPRVISYLMDSVKRAEHPSRWRPPQAEVIRGIARQLGVVFPEGAGQGAL